MLQSPVSGRYRLHDLLRAYACERAREEEPPGDRHAALRRMLQWYLSTAAAAARIISPARPHPPLGSDEPGVAPLAFTGYGEALAWLDAEHANLVVAVSRAAANAEHEIARNLPLELWDLFQLRGHVDMWIETHTVGIASARALGDTDGERRLLNNLAGAYFAAGRLEDAAKSPQQTIELAGRLGKTYTATSLNLGLTLIRLNRAAEAVVLLADAKEQFRREGNATGEHAALICLGAALRRDGQPAQALVIFREALETATDQSLGYYESDALVEMTEARLALGEFQAAITDGTAAVELARKLGYRENEALALDALGRAQLAGGHPAEARAVWRDAITIFSELGKESEAKAVAARLEPHGAPSAAHPAGRFSCRNGQGRPGWQSGSAQPPVCAPPTILFALGRRPSWGTRPRAAPPTGRRSPPLVATLVRRRVAASGGRAGECPARTTVPLRDSRFPVPARPTA